MGLVRPAILLLFEMILLRELARVRCELLWLIEMLIRMRIKKWSSIIERIINEYRCWMLSALEWWMPVTEMANRLTKEFTFNLWKNVFRMLWLSHHAVVGSKWREWATFASEKSGHYLFFKFVYFIMVVLIIIILRLWRGLILWLNWSLVLWLNWRLLIWSVFIRLLLSFLHIIFQFIESLFSFVKSFLTFANNIINWPFINIGLLRLFEIFLLWWWAPLVIIARHEPWRHPTKEARKHSSSRLNIFRFNISFTSSPSFWINCALLCHFLAYLLAWILWVGPTHSWWRGRKRAKSYVRFATSATSSEFNFFFLRLLR